MSAPFQPGESVLCWRPCEGEVPAIWEPTVGFVYTVAWGANDVDDEPIIGLIEDPYDDGINGFDADAFRRVELRQDFDFREQLRKLPVKQPVSA